jgi:hypothetical protein
MQRARPEQSSHPWPHPIDQIAAEAGCYAGYTFHPGEFQVQVGRDALYELLGFYVYLERQQSGYVNSNDEPKTHGHTLHLPATTSISWQLIPPARTW